MLLGKLDHQLLCVTPEFGGKMSLYYEEEPDLRAYHQSLLDGDVFILRRDEKLLSAVAVLTPRVIAI